MQIRDDDTSEDLVQSLAPMIDVVFLLLIFFMVATTFVEREKEMGIDLPTAQSGEEASFDAEEIVINLLEEGRIRLNGEDVSPERLDQLLAGAAAVNPETPVTIRGDRMVHHEAIVGVMDACGVAGLSNLSVGTMEGS